MKDRYGVVHDQDRIEYEKKWQVPYGYRFISFDYKEAKDICKSNGEGYAVEKISSGNEREIIYRA